MCLTVWNTFLTRVVHKATWLSSDREERLESVSREETTLVLGRVVGHEVDDEVVCIWCDEAREWVGEVVWVVLNGVLSSVVGLSSSLVVGQSSAVLFEKAVEVVPSVHFEEADEAVVHVCITLWSCVSH